MENGMECILITNSNITTLHSMNAQLKIFNLLKNTSKICVLLYGEFELYLWITVSFGHKWTRLTEC